MATTVNLMRCLAERQRVTLEADLAAMPRVTCFPAKINLVIQSLVSNAIDACPPGGRVVVETHAIGDGVAIEVSDTGCGIDPSIGDRIFDPFVTTKPIGKGTGLGLAIELRDREGPRRPDPLHLGARPGHAVHRLPARRAPLRDPRRPRRPPGAGGTGVRGPKTSGGLEIELHGGLLGRRWWPDVYAMQDLLRPSI